mmetsp:Transcript_37099/g.96235  ORF Transcript_37099/g.96235 Transcript_37099/m.96235 type:complete len:311 (-) Transcript_37099:374-1306(-)
MTRPKWAPFLLMRKRRHDDSIIAPWYHPVIAVVGPYRWHRSLDSTHSLTRHVTCPHRLLFEQNRSQVVWKQQPELHVVVDHEAQRGGRHHLDVVDLQPVEQRPHAALPRNARQARQRAAVHRGPRGVGHTRGLGLQRLRALHLHAPPRDVQRVRERLPHQARRRPKCQHQRQRQAGGRAVAADHCQVPVVLLQALIYVKLDAGVGQDSHQRGPHAAVQPEQPLPSHHALRRAGHAQPRPASPAPARGSTKLGSALRARPGRAGAALAILAPRATRPQRRRRHVSPHFGGRTGVARGCRWQVHLPCHACSH